MVNVHEVRFEYEKQSQVYVTKSSLYNKTDAGYINYLYITFTYYAQSPGELHWQKSWLS